MDNRNKIAVELKNISDIFNHKCNDLKVLCANRQINLDQVLDVDSISLSFNGANNSIESLKMYLLHGDSIAVRGALPYFLIKCDDFTIQSILKGIKRANNLEDVGNEFNKVDSIDVNYDFDLFLECIKALSFSPEEVDLINAFESPKMELITTPSLDEYANMGTNNVINTNVARFSSGNCLSKSEKDFDSLNIGDYDNTMICFEYYLKQLACSNDFLKDNDKIRAFKRMLVNYLKFYLHFNRCIFTLLLRRDNEYFDSFCQLDSNDASLDLTTVDSIVYQEDSNFKLILDRVKIIIDNYFNNFIEDNNGRLSQYLDELKDAADKKRKDKAMKKEERTKRTKQRKEKNGRNANKSSMQQPASRILGQDFFQTVNSSPIEESFADKVVRIIVGEDGRAIFLEKINIADKKANASDTTSNFLNNYWNLRKYLNSLIYIYDWIYDKEIKGRVHSAIKITYDLLVALIDTCNGVRITSQMSFLAWGFADNHKKLWDDLLFYVNYFLEEKDENELNLTKKSIVETHKAIIDLVAPKREVLVSGNVRNNFTRSYRRW